jgi:osmoprotectant transport system substrate-binding protein
MKTITKRTVASVMAASTLFAATACGSSNPLDDTASSTKESSSSIVIGSANFTESEILANVYAQSLEDNGIKTTLKPNIGARDVYLAALADGSIDLIPEYTGNLLQYYDKNSTATTSDDVLAALTKAIPSQLTILDQAEAQDADSINVTQEFSKKNNVTSIADLAKIDDLSIAAPPEFATRPYGITGLKSQYGVEATLVPINDGGESSTVKALVDGTVQLANIYSTSPSIKENNLVTLKDPKQMILPQHIIPLAKKNKISTKVSKILNTVQNNLTTEDLIEMNTKSSDQKLSAKTIASDWLKSKQLF